MCVLVQCDLGQRRVWSNTRKLYAQFYTMLTYNEQM